MAVLSDYLEWRGDLELERDPLNEVDCMLLAWISYVDFEEILFRDIRKNTFRTVADNYLGVYHLEEELKRNLFYRTAGAFLVDAAARKRFEKCRIVDYQADFSKEREEQFTALTFAMTRDTDLVVFGGTDNSLIGWKEDFNLTYMSEIPSQIQAVDYLNKMIRKRRKKIIVIGHSKGGNLAVYAGMKAVKALKKFITKIYNFDGPGFDQKTIESEEYQQILPVITTFVPQSSIVGMLFGHKEQFVVVKSVQHGIIQHDLTSWEISANHFIRMDGVDNMSLMTDEAISGWIEKMMPLEREQFLNAVFEILKASEASTLEELAKLSPKKINAMITAMNSLDEEQKKILKHVTKKLLDSSGVALTKHVQKVGKMLPKIKGGRK